MTLRVSAPGKVFLSGEYAVLSGEPALVIAVNRRVQVTLETASAWQLRADNGPCEVITNPDFINAKQRPATTVALAIWCAARALDITPAPLAVHVDSRALQQADTKLGLGSSAAVSVALMTALAQHTGSDRLSLDACFRAHDLLQGAVGSGFDVAAAWHGGCFAFERDGQATRIADLPRPPQHHCFVWTGVAARTAGFVDRYRHWAAQSAHSSALVARLGAATRVAKMAVEAGDGPRFAAALADSASGLKALAEAASLPIFAGGHARLLDLADAHHVAYKPCGAGGGDVGIAAADNAADLAAFERAAEDDGFTILSMECDPHGVRVE